MENDRGSKGNAMELVLRPKIEVTNWKIRILGFWGSAVWAKPLNY